MNRMTLRFVLAFVFCVFLLPAKAEFTSMQVFGDGVSSITNNISPGTNYYGNRFCNGRVWVEVLAQRQGLSLATNQNLSFFGHYSPNLVTNVNNFVAPTDVDTALFVIWVNDADFVYCLNNPAQFSPYTSNNIAVWTNAINQSLSNHMAAVQTLYAKGVRTLVMPNAVDVTKTPFYQFAPADENFVRQRIIAFNVAFTNRLNQLKATLPGLAIITPDFFSLVDDLVAHPTNYGLTNSLSDALDDFGNTPLNGRGTNYVFWDYLNPTAKVQEILADTTQPLISPSGIAGIKSIGSSNQITVVNLPVGLNGFVDGTTNFISWSPGQGFNSTNATQTLTVPISGPTWFYRLRFPFAWSWP